MKTIYILFLPLLTVPKYDDAFVDPEKDNISAIRSYEKSGFVIQQKIKGVMWMIKAKDIICDIEDLWRKLHSITRQIRQADDHFKEFG